MEWKLLKQPLTSLVSDAIVVFYHKNDLSLHGILQEVDEALSFRISSLIQEGEVKGDKNEITVMHNWGKISSKRVYIVGLGNEDDLTLQTFKNSVEVVIRQAIKQGCSSLGIGCPTEFLTQYNPIDVVQSMVEGVLFGSYRYPSYSSNKPKDKELTVWVQAKGLEESTFEAGVYRGSIYANATNLARSLTYEPANRLTPDAFQEIAIKIAEQRGMKSRVIIGKELEKLGMNALYSVGKASSQAPRMIVLEYQGAPESDEVLGLIGKGVIFDSGGVQVKPWKDMDEMKNDMGGAAAVLAAMDAIGQLRPHVNVIAVLPVCENLIDGNGLRPGDVIQSYSGKTIEVVHTDAEGRLILADAITFAKNLGATRLVDVATLTGAVVIALGQEMTGMCTNHPQWGEEVKKAAEVVGEPLWELPMEAVYDHYVKSEIADVKNMGGREAGVIQGGKFLQFFVEDTPWVHLDIGGTVLFSRFVEEKYNRNKPSGVATRTLIELATRFS